MPAKTDSKPAARPLPADLSEVALIDGPMSAAVGDMSLSWWLDEVRAGRAPAPVIRKPRCTRWRLADVRRYWSERAEKADAEAAAQVTAQATRASAKAKANRKAKAARLVTGQ